jgi:hypothetical protein
MGRADIQVDVQSFISAALGRGIELTHVHLFGTRYHGEFFA